MKSRDGQATLQPPCMSTPRVRAPNRAASASASPKARNAKVTLHKAFPSLCLLISRGCQGQCRSPAAHTRLCTALLYKALPGYRLHHYPLHSQAGLFDPQELNLTMYNTQRSSEDHYHFSHHQDSCSVLLLSLVLNISLELLQSRALSCSPSRMPSTGHYTLLV